MVATDATQYVARIRTYQVQPKEWVKDFYGENLREAAFELTGVRLATETGLTRQQEEALEELGKLIDAKLRRHRKEEIPEELLEYVHKIGISIQSGQGTGKDFWGALILLFFLSCFSCPKCLATANTAKQLRNVYWAEISKLMRLAKRLDPDNPTSPTILEHLFMWQAERVFLKEKQGREWFAEAVTINAKASPEEQATALAGRHENYMLMIVDEATGVPDPVFKPLEGTLTGAVNLLVLIFNPTKSKGFAIESHKTGSRFVRIRWNAEDSEIVSRAHIEGMERKYGRDSNPFRIRVLGLPPLSDSDTLIPWDWVENAVDKELEVAADDPVILGVDVAAGGDKSVIVVRQGPKVLKVIRKDTKDTMELVGWVGMEMDTWGAKVCGIDVIGLGHGVYTRLRERGYKVVPVDARKTPKRPDRFKKMRDEIWWGVRERFEEGTISIPNDQDLIDQLGSIKYAPESSGQVKVEGKKEMRARGLASPDEADAMNIAFHINDLLYRKSARPVKADMGKVFMR
jgi:phage terminase large subunit